MGAVVALLHMLGCGTLLALVVPQQLALGSSQMFGIGLASGFHGVAVS